ncbi:uncharacterized protein BO72DRAFT_450498 [Aspergillus fijiensis CBS 313.89]|uniref:Apple domain-containing protein n=1 Tax=Aspergillus fijiensis CBS 313.89 TaxID=1448319 RepID=A0A8G1VZ34_9EURO|nr:uncharacterized protein BO72DRAFT_450498 [Aspergillus fijiensis CBS 313.89]RAK74614.1 hypothetical protein BO72DRAFT_450498 [Aspergillus fijiensis CBS 313.89]
MHEGLAGSQCMQECTRDPRCYWASWDTTLQNCYLGDKDVTTGSDDTYILLQKSGPGQCSDGHDCKHEIEQAKEECSKHCKTQTEQIKEQCTKDCQGQIEQAKEQCTKDCNSQIDQAVAQCNADRSACTQRLSNCEHDGATCDSRLKDALAERDKQTAALQQAQAATDECNRKLTQCEAEPKGDITKCNAEKKACEDAKAQLQKALDEARAQIQIITTRRGTRIKDPLSKENQDLVEAVTNAHLDGLCRDNRLNAMTFTTLNPDKTWNEWEILCNYYCETKSVQDTQKNCDAGDNVVAHLQQQQDKSEFYGFWWSTDGRCLPLFASPNYAWPECWRNSEAQVSSPRYHLVRRIKAFY